MLRLRDIMTTDVLTVSPDATLREAMDLLTSRHVSGAPVVAGTEVVGVVSLTDLAEFAASLPGTPAERPRVSEDEFEPPAEWIEGDESLSSFFADMWEDAGSDVAERFAETTGPEWNVLEEHTVDEVMSRALHTLPPETTVERAAEYLRDAAVHRVLVMEDGKLVGLVSTSDIVRLAAERKLQARTYVFGPPSHLEDRP